MSFGRTFKDNLRQQTAGETESDAVGRVRFYAAGLSMLFGIFGLIAFLPIALGEMPWAAAPGAALMIAGGGFGFASQRAADVASSRRHNVWAAACTLLGFAEFFLVNAV